MADKHILTLDVLKQYNIDLTVPKEVEFNIVSLSPIDEARVSEFARQNGFGYTVKHVDDVYLATLTKQLVINEQNVRPLSESVEALSKENGWGYDGWGACSWK